MNKKILLVEPNYKNKYPPLGLMKIATYHHILEDNVHFFKGDLKEFSIQIVAQQCIAELNELGIENVDVDKLKLYIKKRSKSVLAEILSEVGLDNHTIADVITKYKSIYWNPEHISYPKFDRVYISTLFTFYWKVTVDSINYCKRFVRDVSDVKVGGVMATVLYDDIINETGIIPIKGLLDQCGIFDDNDIVIDRLPLDYSILDQIEYEYPAKDSYYGYLTRGCIRKCPFCAVPILEPKFQDFISYKERKEYIDQNYGEQRNLLLLDNNVLASKQLDLIISEIIDLGFYKGATLKKSSPFANYIHQIKNGVNLGRNIHKTLNLLTQCSKRNAKVKQCIYFLLKQNNVDSIEEITSDFLIDNFDAIKVSLDEFFSKQKPIMRYVDFNQGIDARLLDERKMELLSKIAIRPLRIAFDNIKDKDIYVSSIRLAAKYDINNLSNYILYNERDTPAELYERLRINVELCDELNINIYSFPMKYHPIVGKEKLNRDYLGKHWNRKFIRAVQTILNATKGKVGKGTSFFEEAFGANVNDFEELLYMPETFILYRKYFRELGLTEGWRKAYRGLNESDLQVFNEIVGKNDFSKPDQYPSSIQNVLKYYTISRDDIQKTSDSQYMLTKSID